jgi:hypothetical protein
MAGRRGWLWLLGLGGLLYAANRQWNRRFVTATNRYTAVSDGSGRQFDGRHIRVQSILDAHPDAVWQAIQRLALLEEVSAPILAFRPRGTAAVPPEWGAGDSATFDLLAFGAIPAGAHTINVVEVDHARRKLSTREQGSAAQVWNHTIWVQDTGNGRTLYTDDVDIYAGPLTTAVAAFASFFYRYRQTRWQQIAPELG